MINIQRKKLKNIFVGIILLTLGLILAGYFNKLPLNSTFNSASDHYIKEGVRESGSLNLVTSILYDYRAFDSLGESTVIFAAVSGIVLILSRKRLPVSSRGLTFIVKRTFGLLTPFIFLFSIYLMLHGHLSPGGGFQGGVILAVISIIFSVVYGSAFDYNKYSPDSKTIIETGGALVFIIVAILGILIDGIFLSNLPIFKARIGKIISAGSIPLINISIGFKVGAGLAIMFYSMIQKTFEED
ncbi:hydrogen gas-evolving membrane-bound hydrogenase subunit E [Halothermothrix orenii]|uniref:Na+/H+ antiporter MnhB subunit-related protein n=1 Tax=Halothermothrix orenii (strain H 168 / OCM 544 / DSM 9562) TaxID=373903 RepID=B8CXD9_HALOH|nr:hydrogen gas-evolving membrane-bound hydrogenase subunit E [Halothermothrix orenii]ACL69958.1 Na+/H+ antiporter MnhB subunit-related protein [Halothermothrix orenii H 168]